MGHATVKNLSEIFVRQLYAKGKVSIKEVAEFAHKKGEHLCASEGEYEEIFMIAMALEEIVLFLRGYHQHIVGGAKDQIIEPHEMTPEQEKVYNDFFFDNGVDKWDSGDDGFGGEYGLFDSIKWKFAEGWRKQYPDIPILTHISN